MLSSTFLAILFSDGIDIEPKSIEELNDYFADLCTDDAYTKPVPAIVDKSLKPLRYQKDTCGIAYNI